MPATFPTLYIIAGGSNDAAKTTLRLDFPTLIISDYCAASLTPTFACPTIYSVALLTTTLARSRVWSESYKRNS